LQVKLTWSKSIQVYPNLSKYVHKLLHTNQKSNTGHIQTSQKTNLPKNIIVRKTNHYNTGHIPIITFQKIKSMSKKNIYQCFHSGLFFFYFDYIICNPFQWNVPSFFLWPLLRMLQLHHCQQLVGFLESIQLLSLLCPSSNRPSTQVNKNSRFRINWNCPKHVLDSARLSLGWWWWWSGSCRLSVPAWQSKSNKVTFLP
jgi:hypothetical protein